MMTAVWNIRRALPTDVEAICAIEQGCAEAPHWSEAVWREVLAENEGSEPARVSLVAEGSCGIVGFVVVSCACGVAELESVAVGEAARRQGVGRALCREAMAWSRGRFERQAEVRWRCIARLTLLNREGGRGIIVIR